MTSRPRKITLAVLRAGLDALEAAGEPTPEEALRVLARIVKTKR